MSQSRAETENLRKRKECKPSDLGRERCSLSTAALKPGSALDQTLQKLIQQLMEVGRATIAKESVESRKSRRKGTPR